MTYDYYSRVRRDVKRELCNYRETYEEFVKNHNVDGICYFMSGEDGICYDPDEDAAEERLFRNWEWFFSACERLDLDAGAEFKKGFANCDSIIRHYLLRDAVEEVATVDFYDYAELD